MLFPLWKLVNQLQRQFPYTVWFYCVWPGHLISISSCWEQRVNFISSLSFMQTARVARQGQLAGSPTLVGGRRRASWSGLAVSLSILRCEPEVLLLTRTLANSPGQAYFLKEWGMWDYFFLSKEFHKHTIQSNPNTTNVWQQRNKTEQSRLM